MEQKFVTTDATERRDTRRGAPGFRKAGQYREHQRGAFTLHVVRASNAVPGPKTSGEWRVIYGQRAPFDADLRMAERILDRAGTDPELFDRAADQIMELCVDLVRVCRRMITDRRERLAAYDHPEPPRAA